jgi:hypothetical protein
MGPSLFVGEGVGVQMNEIDAIPEHKERMYEIFKALYEAGDIDEYDLYGILSKYAVDHDVLDDDGFHCEQCGQWNFCYQAECKADF